MDNRTTLLILKCDDQLVGVDTAMIREVSPNGDIPPPYE